MQERCKHGRTHCLECHSYNKHTETSVCSNGLLSCPFCGAEAHYFTGLRSFDVGCYTDGCIMRCGTDVGYSTRESAAKQWNTRAG